MSRKIKWAVIGSGGIARRRTIPEGLMVADNAELIAVNDIAEKVNKEVAQETGAKALGSVDEILKSDAEAIYIATPLNAHCEQVLACAQAGKHILCEKPLGMDVAEVEKMMAACKKAGVLLGTGLMMRFSSQHQEVLKMIQDGKLGKPVYARAQLSCWYPPMNAWRQDPALGGGGSLMDMGSHCMDLLEMLLGPVEKVSCFINCTVHDYKSEDSAIVNMFFKNGALATVDSFFCIPDDASKNILEVYGSKGSVLARGTVGQGEAGEMTAYLQEGDGGYDAAQARTEGGGIKIAPTPINTYRGEIEEFSQAIIDGREPSNNAEIGLQSQKVLTACYESARTGKVVEVK